MPNPYNSTPSLPLQEAFNKASAACRETSNIRYVSHALKHMHLALSGHDKAITRAYNAAHRAAYLTLAALHDDDIEAAQSSAQDALDARREAETVLQTMFEAYMVASRNSEEGQYKLFSKQGAVGTFGSISIDPAVGDEEEFVYLHMNYPDDPSFDMPF